MQLWFAFNKRSLTTHSNCHPIFSRVVICFSTNDLWQQLNTGFDTLNVSVVICFQQTIFDNQFNVVIRAFGRLWFAFQQTIFDNQFIQHRASQNQLWFAFNKRSLTTKRRQTKSTPMRLWFVFNKRSLTTKLIRNDKMGMVVICFSTNVFDN